MFKKGFILSLILLSQSVLADLIVYTDRSAQRFTNVSEQFFQLTGEKLHIVEMAYPALKQRLEIEGSSTSADMVFVKDFVFLNELVSQNYLKPLRGNNDHVVPPSMKHSQNLWTGISYRVRTVIYNPSAITSQELSSLMDLNKPEYSGRICVRSGQHPYNMALVSSLVHHYGFNQTQEFISSLMGQLATEPFANDKAVIEAVATGNCDLGIVNHYYLAPYIDQNKSFPVKPLFLDQTTVGSHTNGTGMGQLKSSNKDKLAKLFLDLMLSDKNQSEFSAAHFDYPVSLQVQPETVIKTWGQFNKDKTPWEKFAVTLEDALLVIKNANYK